MMQADDPDREPTSRSFISQGLALNYVDWGNAGAPTLIFVHGMRDHARSWDRIARAFQKDWHVVAPDLRGHGDSAWSVDGAYLTAFHVLDLAALVEVLGSGPVTLIGHSFGGGVASRYAALFPDRIAKLAIIDGFGPSPTVYAKWEQEGPVQRTREWIAQRRNPKFSTLRRLATVEDGIARMKLGNARLSDEQARHLTVHGLRQYPDGFSWKYDPKVSMFAPEDFAIKPAEFWSEVTAPTLLSYGTETWSGNPETNGCADCFKDSQTVAIENAGHWPHHDQPDIFIDTLRAFL